MIKLIDLFCGAGGVTTGFEAAVFAGNKVADVMACVNHDAVAIDSHFSNHAHVKHYTEDIRTLDTHELAVMVDNNRLSNPEDFICLWASLECTNFSKAKGGLPRDGDSRTLANHMFRYIKAVDPDYVMIENVEEFMSWGPLDKEGKPISKRNGSDYVKWCNNVQRMGYTYDHRILNSADFGAYTSRKRLFIIFAKTGLPVAWPVPTHAKKPEKLGMFGQLTKWKAVRDVLDLEDVGNSIFGRKKDLSEKTLARIYAGLIKFVAGGKDQFLVKYNSMSSSGGYAAPDLNNPAPVIPTRNMLYLASAQFISKYFSGSPEHKNITVDGPAGTVKCIDNQALISPQFLALNYSTGGQLSEFSKPCPTLTTKDRVSIVSPQFIEKRFGSDANHQGIDQPAGSIMSNDKNSLVTPFIVDTQFNNTGSKIGSPLPVITANRKYHYLLNPQWAVDSGASLQGPCGTLIARMDKAPLYLITTEEGYLAIEIFETDSEYTQKIKIFMAMYGIVDIKMRMLKVNELLNIQGFPKGYILKGTQADQKKFIGNSVVPLVAQRMAEALAGKLLTQKIEAA